jgi:hypothetical protein
MPDSTYKVDEVAANLIASRKVCPLLLDCPYLTYGVSQNTGSIKFAIRYCGNEYNNCHVYKCMKSDELES